MTRYIGIDPSTKTGLCEIDQNGNVINALEITSDKKDIKRYMDIAEKVVHELDFDSKVFIEGFSYQSKGKAVSTQYGIGYAIRYELEDEYIQYTEIAPTSLKKFATGKGNTKKEDMILPIYKRWGYENDSDNIRDAFILAQIGRYLDGHGEPTKFQSEVLTKIQKGD